MLPVQAQPQKFIVIVKEIQSCYNGNENKSESYRNKSKNPQIAGIWRETGALADQNRSGSEKRNKCYHLEKTQ